MTIRPICPACQKKFCAVNYVSKGVTHYRSKCDRCIRASNPIRPYWMRAGYRKKPHCEKCGFKAKHKEQLEVYHIDGKRSNNQPMNLKTICKNCAIDVVKSKVGWSQGDLTPDF